MDSCLLFGRYSTEIEKVLLPICNCISYSILKAESPPPQSLQSSGVKANNDVDDAKGFHC